MFYNCNDYCHGLIAEITSFAAPLYDVCFTLHNVSDITLELCEFLYSVSPVDMYF